VLIQKIALIPFRVVRNPKQETQTIDERNKVDGRAEIIFSSTNPVLQRQLEQTTVGLIESTKRLIANL
jgi:hypothetical protein